MTNKSTIPRATLAAALLFFSAAASAAGPQFHRHEKSNEREEGEHYRDSGEHPREVSAPGITLQSRALLDKAGSTEFELSTGKLDINAIPPGNINEVKLRLVQPDAKKGEHEGDRHSGFEKKFEDLRMGGYVHFALAGLGHNQILDVKAEVGLDSGSPASEDHHDVELKLQDVVKYRPDLTVQKLDFPQVARPGTDVRFSAIIAEHMGDLGGHGDCVLLVDGKRVDAAKGIWVDAAGAVTCRLTYNFGTSGLHTVAARIENNIPADYDGSNNELSGQIQVQNPANIFYSANAFDTTTVTDRTTDYYVSGLSTVPNEHKHDSSTQAVQGRYFYGQIPSALNLPLKNVAYADSSGGKALTTLAFADLAADGTTPSMDPAYTTMSYISRYDSVSAGWMSVCIYKNAATGAGTTLVDWSWDAGDVTYHSDGYCKSAASGYRCSGGDYTLNVTSTSAVGPRVTLAGNYSANVVADDGTPYSAQPAMDLVSAPPSTTTSSGCQLASLGGPGYGKICTTTSSTTTSKSGSAVRLQ